MHHHRSPSIRKKGHSDRRRNRRSDNICHSSFWHKHLAISQSARPSTKHHTNHSHRNPLSHSPNHFHLRTFGNCPIMWNGPPRQDFREHAKGILQRQNSASRNQECKCKSSRKNNEDTKERKFYRQVEHPKKANKGIIRKLLQLRLSSLFRKHHDLPIQNLFLLGRFRIPLRHSHTGPTFSILPLDMVLRNPLESNWFHHLPRTIRNDNFLRKRIPHKSCDKLGSNIKTSTGLCSKYRAEPSF